MLNKYNNDSLARERKDVINLLEADVYISKGNLDGYTLPSTLSEFETMLEEDFDCIGVNAKDSPDYKSEPIAEEVDYEKIELATKVTGNIKLKLINSELLNFLDVTLTNEESTILIVPKNYQAKDVTLIINGVKLVKTYEGKSNSEGMDTVTLSFLKKAKRIGDVLVLYKIPEDIPA